jgi:hypothetical protein
VFLKREDLLPFGGGSKVRRLLGAPALRDAPRRIAVLSERGAHTFVALARMRAGGALGDRDLLFWERGTPRTPYAEGNRARYAAAEGVRVRPGPLPVLLLRMLAARLFRRRSTRVLGIGGTVAGGRAAHRAAFEECVRQLAEAGVAGGRVGHVVAAASGAMADGFLDAIEAARLEGHRVLAVLTGPRAARARLRLRWLGKRHVLAARAPRFGEDEERSRLEAFRARTGVRLDPRHVLPAAAWLDAPPAALAGADALVLWVTCPRLDPVGLP